MSLLSSLTTVTNALAAQNLGLDVVGQNLANINTPGYARRSLELQSVAPGTVLEPGRGVEVAGIRAFRDAMVDARVWREHGGSAHDGAIADMLATVEILAGLPGHSLDAELQRFFSAFQSLADDPTSPVARDIVVREGQNLGGAFRSLSSALLELQRDADGNVRSQVQEVNKLAAELAELNRRIGASESDIDTLRDRQSVILDRLGELAGVSVISREDGGVDVTIPSGQAIVIGANAYLLETSPAGLASISLGGFTVTSALTGGSIGGLLQVRDALVPGYLSSLDQLAYDVATAVNAIHSTGFDATGAAAGNFFTPLAGAAGAAGMLFVEAALELDPQRVAASATGAIGDNGIARSLAALRNAQIAGGGTRTAVEAWSDYLFTVGSDAADARAAEASHQQILIQLQGLQAQISGVSADEEAAHLMRFQRAYEANARYFQTILSTLDTLMDMVK